MCRSWLAFNALQVPLQQFVYRQLMSLVEP